MTDVHRILTDEDNNDLRRAHRLLQNPSLAARIVDKIGEPIEKGMKKLPEDWNKKIVTVTELALTKAADAALYTLDDAPHREASNWWHKAAVAASGGVGGFFGLSALAIELPVSTTIMLRSIIDIARSQGESISDQETKAACLEVFALGSSTNSKDDDAAETGYYATRIALGSAITEASKFAAKVAAETAAKGAEKAVTSSSVTASQPILITMIRKIAERFSISITDKAMAQLVPAVGAIGGAAINTIFIDHFQDMATGHFIVRRLEKRYGIDVVKSAYAGLTHEKSVSMSKQ